METLIVVTRERNGAQHQVEVCLFDRIDIIAPLIEF